MELLKRFGIARKASRQKENDFINHYFHGKCDYNCYTVQAQMVFTVAAVCARVYA